MRRDAKLSPLLHGGPQEVEKRAGTENVLGIASTAFALQFHEQSLEQKQEKMARFRQKLKQGILDMYPDARINESADQLAQTLNVSFLGLNGNLLLTNLDLEAVSASYGSACASGSLEISHVLLNMGLNIEYARSAIRLSFGWATQEAEIDELLLRLKTVIDRMK